MCVLGQQEYTGLQKYLHNAAMEIEYYKTLFSTHKTQAIVPDLSEFPLLTRQTVQHEHGRFFNGRSKRYPEIGHLLIKRSFGPSGVPLEVYWDDRDDARSQAFLWAYRKERFGISDDDKHCIFCTADYSGNKIMDYLPQYLSWDEKTLLFTTLDLSPEILRACLEKIIAFDPAWIILPPSIALMIVETIKLNRMSLPSSLRHLEFYGETLDTQMEIMLQDFFRVQTSNVYTTQATGAVAASCMHGHLHVFSGNVVVEVIRAGKPVVNEEGDVYITSLQNTAMPLVRLKTGDRGLLQSEPCSCGQSAPILSITHEKDHYFITSASGRKISASMLRSLVEFANEEVSRCIAYIQFRQIAHDSFDVILGVKPAFAGWEEEVTRVFCEQIRDTELKQMRWNFFYIDTHNPYEPETSGCQFFELLDKVKKL